MAQRWLATCDDCPGWQHVAPTALGAEQAGNKHATTAHADTLTPAELVTAHVGLAVTWTRRAHPNFTAGETWDEVYADALLGLWDAAQRWTPGRARFATFASHRIRGQIADGRRQRDPLHRSDRARGIPLPLSLDAALDAHAALVDVIPDPHDDYATVDDTDEHDQRVTAIREACADLPPKQAAVVEGVLANRTLRDIGADLGVTEARACQLRQHAETRLRALVAA